MTATSEDGLAEVFDQLIGAIHKGSDSDVLDEFVRMDLTLTQVRVVIMLAVHGNELPINEVADCLKVSVATAGRTVDRLVTLGLAERREDPDDRRSKLVSLTSEGQRLADLQREGMRDHIRAFSRELPDEVAVHLRDAIAAALDAIPEHLRAGATCSLNNVRTSS
ncbi:MarR family winged helix-turn-helix transcriptional regulator [Tomitella fengzijianii]|uniref:MarR family transcriptional regulator n=1 Tax=Tomitella fengzijianii TaxID=2597660 RepID=A0A516X0H1_9ACTN|nr:MarR family transcriptional regulator [Tomitella fengzijianii]QDQ96558.1 MarR family transcriptional regulator [Tomitella fengzijianii]